MSEKKTWPRKGGPLVIGTGLPRTGTTSLYQALEKLGYAPCHHFRGMATHDSFPFSDQRLWARAAKTEDKELRQDMLHYLLTKYRSKAAVDYPISGFVEDMVEMYPNAKFIHTERSSPEVWRKSFNETVGRLLQDKVMYYATAILPFISFGLVPVLSALDDRNQRLFNARIYSFDSQTELYNRHNAFVRQVVPKDRLLEFDLKKGYPQLCGFLKISVPTDEQGNKLDFPHVNDKERMKRGLKVATIMGFVGWGISIGGLYLLFWMLGLA